MRVYAYCVRRAGEPPPEPGVRGVLGAEVARVEGEGVGLWVSRVEAAPPAEAERLREHDRVVRAALRTATPLPLRFGTLFGDEAAAFAVLAPRRDALLAALRRVEGRVEMGAALLWDAAAAREEVLAGRPELRPLEREPAGGREYLEARRRERALEEALRGRADGLLQALSAALADALPGAEEVRAVAAGAEVAGTVAWLVQRSQVFTFRAAAERAAEALPGVTLRISGPWAPYSFV